MLYSASPGPAWLAAMLITASPGTMWRAADAIYSGSRSDVLTVMLSVRRRDEIDESSMDDLSRKLVEDLRCAWRFVDVLSRTHRHSPLHPAPGLAHICAGTRPTSAPGLAHICAGACPTSTPGLARILAPWGNGVRRAYVRSLVPHRILGRSWFDMTVRPSVHSRSSPFSSRPVPAWALVVTVQFSTMHQRCNATLPCGCCIPPHGVAAPRTALQHGLFGLRRAVLRRNTLFCAPSCCCGCCRTS